MRAAAIVVTLFVTGTAMAADDNKVIFPSGTGHSTSPAPGAGGSFNTITLVLALMLAAVGAWMMWRNRKGGATGRESRALAIEETRSLGNRQYLVVASYEGQKFLLGVCQGRIDMLSQLQKRGSSQDSSS